MMSGVRTGDEAPSPDDWLRPREIADLLDVPLRRVQESFRVDALRTAWWEPDGVRAWEREPLTARTQYRARRWAVMRLVDQNEQGDQ